jgi:ABC-type transporter Mla MlaB component
VEHPSPREPAAIAYDVSGLTQPDQRALEALARLQLTARRLGTTIRLHHASRALVELIEVAGLADVLVVVSGVEVDGKVEELEQGGIDEEVHRGDRTL